MKIAICNVQEFNPMIGGVERVSVSLATELKRLGHEVIFVAQRRCPWSGEYVPVAPQFMLPDSDDYTPENVAALTDLLRSEHVDVMINQNGHSYLYNRLIFEARRASGVPVVSVLHFDPMGRLNSRRGCVNLRMRSLKDNLKAAAHWIALSRPLRRIGMADQRRLFRQLVDGSDAVALLSPRFREGFLKVAGLDNAPNLTAIYNMLSWPLDADVRYEKENIILSVGRLYWPQKRLDQLLRAWKLIQDRLPDWRLVIAGDGPDRSRLETLASDLRLKRVEFAGFVNPREYYEKSRIFALTSAHEGLPMTISEAMQSGCVPVAYMSYESIYDQITDGRSGYLVASGDYKALADRIVALASDRSLLESMSREAIASRSRFTPDTIAREWDTFLKSLKKD